jgi:HTH-type transcriptional regulator, glycine betaine synthesis regulator
MPADTLSAPAAPLTSLETEAIDLFISFLRLLGMPKSIGELYGLLFVSPRPLPMETLIERLNMSKGAASQGLKLLRSFGAIRVVYVPADRRDHYLADFELSRFATNFIKEELQPHFDRAAGRLERMEKFLATLPDEDREATRLRLERLRHWQEKGQEMLPWILKFLVA